jgi:uncharacterized membrane protein YcaP (DUF421 family)
LGYQAQLLGYEKGVEEMIEVLNWIACLLTILGTWEVSKLKPNTLKINILYGIGSLILLCIFTQSKNIPMIIMYFILLAFALRGLYLRRIEQDKKDIEQILTKQSK